MYSLLSAAVLACDVARHPYALGLADTLDRALALTPPERAALGRPAPESVRRHALGACAQPRVMQVLPQAAALEPSALLTLDEALLGSLQDVHVLLARELGLAGEALQVVLDAVTAAWAGPAISLRDSLALRAAWDAAVSPVPAALPDAPRFDEVRRLLDEVPRRTTGQWVQSVRAHRGIRGLAWSNAMHVSCAAAHKTDRVRDIARAQLAAARALATAHTGVSPYAAGMVVTAAVQATCTADVVGENVGSALRGPWEAGSSAPIG